MSRIPRAALAPRLSTGQPRHVAAADPIDRLLAAFFAGRSPHTIDAYRRDLDAFAAFLRRHLLMDARPMLGSAQVDTTALRWLLDQSPGRANEIAFAYRADLLSRRKATATIARHLSVLKSVVKYARMTGVVTWAIEVTAPRIEKSRDTRGPSLDTIQLMMTAAARQRAPIGPRDVALLRFAYDLALRIGEIARLDVADVELSTGALWIFGKGRRAKELVTMPQTSRHAVTAWLQDRGTWLPKIGEAGR